MLKTYNKLWVFGDSFTTPNICVDPKDSFWGLAAKSLDVKTIFNSSWTSNSFDSICHTLISMQEHYDWDNDVFFIGIPPLWRLTVFDNYKNTQYNGHDINCTTWQSNKVDIPCHTGLVNIGAHSAVDKLFVIFEDRSWTETQTLRTVFLLTSWLDSKKANYLIYNLSDPLDLNNRWGPSEFLLPYCAEHSRCILFEDTYYSVNVGINVPPDSNETDKWRGHHGPAGNELFYKKSIATKLKQLF